MPSKAGLWIDRRKAVIVLLNGEDEEIKLVSSDLEKHSRYSGGFSETGPAEDVLDRQFDGHLSKYYDKVIAYLRNAESILILGPGEAKVQLEKRLEKEGLKGRIRAVETADKMTDRQIASIVRERFQG